MARKKTFFMESAQLNNLAYYHYAIHIYDLLLSQYEWQNLPESMDERMIEKSLCNNGKVILFNDPVIGPLSLPFTSGGNFDVYGNPVIRRIYSPYNEYHDTRTGADSVIVWNNYTRTASYTDILYYAQILWNCDRISNVNVNVQKTPVILTCGPKERLTFLNLFKEYDGNEPLIKADDSIDLSKVKVFNLNPPFVADKIQLIKEKIWNECLTHLGISNVNITKRERMNTDEVNRNLGGTVASRYSKLYMRQQACETYNRMFGADLWVEFREELDLSLPSAQEEVPLTEGGVSDE